MVEQDKHLIKSKKGVNILKEYKFKNNPKEFLREKYKSYRFNCWNWFRTYFDKQRSIGTRIQDLHYALSFYDDYRNTKREYNFYRKLEIKYRGMVIIDWSK